MLINYKKSLIAHSTLIMILTSWTWESAPIEVVHEAPEQTIQAAGETVRVSIKSSGEQAMEGGSTESSISSNGRYIAFSSDATNLIPGDTNGSSDIFVHDTEMNITIRVSIASNGTQANSYSYRPSVSADGRYIAFQSYATNLVTEDTNGKYDVFVRDMQTGLTTCVSVDSNGVPANEQSGNPAISADGRYIAFESLASNLIADDTNRTSDIFVRDLQAGTTSRISITSSNKQPNGGSMRPSISADGQSIAFASYATNLVTGDTNGKSDIFVRDINTGTTTRAVVEASGSSISADGRYIAFASNATNHVTGDTNGITDVFVYDQQMGITTRVSVDSSGEQANAESGITGNSFLSADGRYVTFYSQATNLVHGDINEFTDIFVHDLQTGMTNRVSKGLSGRLGSSSSLDPAISADGQFITFYSFAINLVENDTNSQTDIFVYRQEIYPTLPTISGNVGVSGVILSYTEDGITKSAISDSDGNYVIQVNKGWSGTLTPSKANTTFVPLERTYKSVQSNMAAQDYIATLTVINSNNRDAGSLRQAIADAASGTTIIFDSSLAGQTIKLASDLVIDKSLRIMGSGLSSQIILHGGNANRLIIPQFYSSNITISDVTITNFAGILAYGGDLNIINSTLTNNAGSWGGVIYSSGTSLVIENSTFTNNQASAEGGAIYLVGSGNVRIVNSTITKNQAKQKGGGLRLQGNVKVEIINSTLAENSAPTGSEFSIKENTSYLDLTNSILVCAQPSTSCYDYLPGSVTITNSILESGALADFGLNMLANNGGPTQTMMLSPDSPATDAGNDSFCPATDQRGVTRPVGSHCDIGAFEFSPKTIYVKYNATGLNNGTSWANAYNDLQSALSTALSGDEIWVAAGTYKPTTGTDRAVSFTLKNGVAIYGGFAGTETVRTQRDFIRNTTVLSGDIGTIGVDNDNSYHVVVSSNTNSSTILDGFTVTGGNADGSSINPQGRGGGMLNVGGEPALDNIIFSNNSATLGGGMFNEGVDLGYGNWNGGDPILTNISFTDNSATEGGGIENMNYSSPTLMNVTFSGNTVTRSGGGMDNLEYSNPSLTNVTFNDNTAAAGGGMSNTRSDPTLINVTFINNTAEIGGGLGNYSSSPTLTNVTFIDNVAIGADPPVTVAPGSGGGIYNGYNSNPVIRNTILWGNTALDGAQVYDATSTPVVSNSVVQDGYASGTNIITADPKLGTLGDYGGFTETIPLLAGSSAIDSGNNGVCPATDQRGVTRPQGSHCDIGAYEYVYPIIPPPTDTPPPTRTPRYPVLKSGVLTPASLTTQFGTTSGSLSSLSLFDQSGTQDNPADYVSFQTLDNTLYLGYQSFTLPEDAQTKLVSTMLLQVNFKAPASPHQVWTWSVYNWSTGMWIPLGDSIGTTPDEWQTLLFRIRQPRRYVSAAGEIRIQLQSENAGGQVKIDYQALHITYLSTPATATPDALDMTSDRPSIFSVPSTPRP